MAKARAIALDGEARVAIGQDKAHQTRGRIQRIEREEMQLNRKAVKASPLSGRPRERT